MEKASLQRFEQKNHAIHQAYLKKKKEDPDSLEPRLNLSWSNWGFGMEDLDVSAARLEKNGIRFIELHGNRYGDDLGYDAGRVKNILENHGISVAGICGMFSAECELASGSGIIRQRCLDYLRRNIDLGRELKADYFLIAPGAVGRTKPIDDTEWDRSVETCRRAADFLTDAGIKGAVEPIRAAEVSMCHTFADALRYISDVNHPGVQHINGDLYHMQAEEAHIGETLAAAGDRLINLHLADSNRCALGDGSLDIDSVIMALYVIGYNRPHCYITPEPLGPGGDPYPAMFGRPDTAVLDALVKKTADYFREREDAVRQLT